MVFLERLSKYIILIKDKLAIEILTYSMKFTALFGNIKSLLNQQGIASIRKQRRCSIKADDEIKKYSGDLLINGERRKDNNQGIKVNPALSRIVLPAIFIPKRGTFNINILKIAVKNKTIAATISTYIIFSFNYIKESKIVNLLIYWCLLKILDKERFFCKGAAIRYYDIVINIINNIRNIFLLIIFLLG